MPSDQSDGVTSATPMAATNCTIIRMIPTNGQTWQLVQNLQISGLNLHGGCPQQTPNRKRETGRNDE